MNKLFDVGSAIVILAGITVMVRPNSKGPDLVKAITSGFSSVLTAATAF